MIHSTFFSASPNATDKFSVPFFFTVQPVGDMRCDHSNNLKKGCGVKMRTFMRLQFTQRHAAARTISESGVLPHLQSGPHC